MVVSEAWANAPGWSVADGVHRAPDRSAVVRWAVDPEGCKVGNALVVIIAGAGERRAQSSKGVVAQAPQLQVICNDGVIADCQCGQVLSP